MAAYYFFLRVITTISPGILRRKGMSPPRPVETYMAPFHRQFATNLFAGLIAYNLLPKKPEMNIEIIDKSRIIA